MYQPIKRQILFRLYVTCNPRKTYLERVYNFKFSVRLAKFSCDLYFPQFCSCYTRNKASRRKNILVHSSLSCPQEALLMTGTQFLHHHYLIRNSPSKWSNTGKLSRNRYKSVITKKFQVYPIKNLF